MKLIGDEMDNQGHCYIRAFERNICIIYRHVIWAAPDSLSTATFNKRIQVYPINTNDIRFGLHNHRNFRIYLSEIYLILHP